jgi:hypothetical protein
MRHGQPAVGPVHGRITDELYHTYAAILRGAAHRVVSQIQLDQAAISRLWSSSVRL